jgi:hypothetical protein
MTRARITVCAATLCLGGMVACQREVRTHARNEDDAPSVPSSAATAATAAPGDRAAELRARPHTDEVPEGTRRAAVLEVLAGGTELLGLPEVAVDPGAAFDPWLRYDLYRPPVAKVRIGVPSLGAGLPLEVVNRGIRRDYGGIRMCYERGLAKRPALKGKVDVSFSIQRSGAVATVGKHASDLQDAAVVRCILDRFAQLRFPKPEGASPISVVCPISFSVE